MRRLRSALPRGREGSPEYDQEHRQRTQIGERDRRRRTVPASAPDHQRRHESVEGGESGHGGDNVGSESQEVDPPPRKKTIRMARSAVPPRRIVSYTVPVPS